MGKPTTKYHVKKKRSLNPIDRVILILGISFVTLLLAVIVCALCSEGDDKMNNVLTVIATSLSGMLLGLTIFYQIRQFSLSRFRTIFQHQMELHAQLVDRVTFEDNGDKKVGSEAIRKIADYITAKLDKEDKLSDATGTGIKKLFTSYQFFQVLYAIFNQYEHVLSPYFRHITSVLDFLSHRAPKEERKDYPKHYLNIFSKCELRLYLFYVVYESNRIAERMKDKDEDERDKIAEVETDLFELLKDINYLRYINAITTEDETISCLLDENSELKLNYYELADYLKEIGKKRKTS